MKTLFIVRHAKSSWDNLDLYDFERPLNDRGKRDAPRMGKRIKEREVTFDLILSSKAKRAYSTGKRIAKALNYPEEKIQTSEALYHADEDEILAVVREIKEPHDVVMIVGHNPGLTDFANALSGETISNIPTCGIVACTLPVSSWKEVSWGKGTMLFFDYPKSKKD